MTIRKINGVLIDADTLDGDQLATITAAIASAVAAEAAARDAAIAAALFASVADDLSDLTRTTVDAADLAPETYATLLNVASGGCRFLGGLMAFEDPSYPVAKITIDGGAEQTLAGIITAEGIIPYHLILPPIKADTSLLIRAYNAHASTPYWWSGQCWHGAL